MLLNSGGFCFKGMGFPDTDTAAGLTANALILADNDSNMAFCPLIILEAFQSQTLLHTQFNTSPTAKAFVLIDGFYI